LDRESAHRKIPTYTKRIRKENRRTQIFISRVGFESTIIVFERAKTVHAFDRAVNVIVELTNGKKNNFLNYP
jgi:hypothetical protein